MRETSGPESQPRSSNSDWPEWRARLLVGLILGTLVATTFHLVDVRWHAHLQWVVHGVTRTLLLWPELLSNFIPDETLDQWLVKSYLLTGFVTGFLAGIQWKWVLSLLKQQIFPSRNRKVILPIHAPQSDDPLWGNILAQAKDQRGEPIHDPIGPMAWIVPTHGARLETWQNLWRFAHDGSSDGRYAFFFKGKWGRFFPQSDDYQPFRWTVLTGRSGSGKTRMATEFLRRELARIHELGEPDAHLPYTRRTPPGANLKIRWKNWARGKRIEAGEWRRRILPWSARIISNPERGQPGDPWDISWVNQSPSYKERSEIYEFLDDLAAWLPRRPTAFLLDDPLPDEAGEVIAVLTAHRKKYRFPVRLLIVNQTVPEELHPAVSTDASHWPSRDSQFYGQVFVLSEETALTSEEIFTAASQMPLPLAGWKRNDHEVETHLKTIAAITEGNPLLVELALRLLVQRVDIRSFTAEMLLRERARRILSSLHAANPALNDKDFQMLASAALAGPYQELGKFDPALPVFGATMPHFSPALRQCFNLAGADKGRALPVVRPEQIGDAFVQLVLSEHCGIPGVPAEDCDPAAKEHRIADQNRVAEQAWRWPGHAGGVLRSVQRTAARTDELGRIMRNGPPPDVPIPLPELAQAYTIASAHVVLGRPWPTIGNIQALSTACGRIRLLEAADVATSVDRVYGLFNVDQTITGLWTVGAAMSFDHAIGRMIELGALPRALEKMAEIVEKAIDARNEAEKGYSGGLPELRGFAHAAVRSLAHEAESAMQNHSEDSRYALVLARAWVLACWAADGPEGCRLVLQKVDAISHKFPGREEFAIEQAKAWRHYCFALGHSGLTRECRNAAQQIDEIVKSFPKQPLLAAESAKAWGDVCYANAWYGKGDGCPEAVANVESLADRFLDLSEFVLQKAEVRKELGRAFASFGTTEDCNRAAQQVDEIANACSEDMMLAWKGVSAWKWVCFANVLHGTEEGCRKALERVVNIASRYPERAQFRAEHADALQCMCAVFGKFGKVKNCEETAQQVEEVARDFSGMIDFDHACSEAWKHVSYTHSRCGTVEGCQKALAKIKAIADLFPGEERFQLTLSSALRNLSYALTRFDRPQGIEGIAYQIEDIASHASAQEKIAENRVLAWTYACWANAKTGNIIGWRQAAGRARQIAEAFPTNQDVQNGWQECLRLVKAFEENYRQIHSGQATNLSPEPL